ncbi:methyl-accepting chemotaxis protein [bacterium]|nr:methyl-accepting chemotaxis protein [bacterium]MBU1884412.1 methyl-accepting chemotaxis protein [bacterium]
MLKHTTIKQRLSILAVVMFLGIGLMYLISAFEESKVKNFNHVNSDLYKLQLLILQERRNEKDFILRNKLKYYEKFTATFSELQKSLEALEKDMSVVNLDTSKVNDLSKIIIGYDTAFKEFVKMQQEIGLDEEDGLRGKMRQAVHDVEAEAKKLHDDSLNAKMLQLRRNEKDFLLRKDDKYIQKHAKNSEICFAYIDSMHLSSADKEKLFNDMKVYEESFKTITSAFAKLGFNETLGIQGEMRDTIHKTESVLSAMLKETESQMHHEISSMKIIYNISVISLIIFIAVLGWLIINSILRPMQKVTAQISNNKNDLTVSYNYDYNDEISKMVNALNAFMKRLGETIHTSKQTSLENVAVANELSVTSMNIGKNIEISSDIINATTTNAKAIQQDLQMTLEKNERVMTEIQSTSQDIDTVSNEYASLIQKIQSSADIELQLAQKLNQLSGDAAQVKEILSIIGDIADQTNLLALNAAIEAARAGEHGRGFAVVADEVRKLAERTQKSLTDIQTSVNMIVQNIVDSAGEMNKNAMLIEDMVTVSNDVNNKVIHSQESMTNTLSLVQESAQSTKQTGVEIQNMISNIVEVNEVSMQNARSVQEIATASEHLSKMTDELNAKLEQFRT